ncbi:MAG: S-layer homology domain-containing protein [Oscillospiraceae bacterium]|nr:S-layer homology domain-containing protein [Oscillospiraceae bacterium]
MSKKIIAFVLAAVLALAPLPALGFTSSDWAKPELDKAQAQGLIPGAFKNADLKKTSTRAEFCALVVALYEKIKGEIKGRAQFTDTKDINVEKAAAIEVVKGVGGNKFDPDAELNREQAAVMLARLAEAVGKPFVKKAATFADRDKIAGWALEAVGQVQAAGIMGGTGKNTFAPKDPYTREQCVITVLRTYDAVTQIRLTDAVFDVVKSGRYHIKMEMKGDQIEAVVEIYAKNGMTAAVTDLMGGMRMVNKNGKTYNIMDAFKTVSVTKSPPYDDFFVIADETKLTYVGEGSGIFKGKTYKYDEYKLENGAKMYYFMSGANLAGMRTIDAEGSVTEMEVLAFDQNVPDSVFVIPSDYELVETD